MQIIQLIKRRALALDEIVVIRDDTGRVAKTVNILLATGIIDSRHQIRINDDTVNHQTCVIFVGWVFTGSRLGFDEIHRGDRWVTKIIEDRHRG